MFPKTVFPQAPILKTAVSEIENLTVGYTLPQEFLKKIAVTKIRVYVSSQNVFSSSQATKGLIRKWVQIPQVKIHNYGYQNNGDLTFTDVTTFKWGLTLPTFSNAAVYADLDNDGTMDMIVNNINDEPLIYKNTSRENDDRKYQLHPGKIQRAIVLT